MPIAKIGDEINIPMSQYAFSDPVVCKEWSGGKIQVKVGFVREHPEKKQILLEKYYTGASGPQLERFYIKDATDWKAIVRAVEGLWPELEKVVTESEIKTTVEKITQHTQLLDTFAKYPQLISNLPDNVDLLSLSSDQKEAYKNFLAASGEVSVKALNRLAQEPVKNIEDLLKILDNYKLSTVVNLVTHITSRIAFINTFEKVINNEDSFERRGVSSVHNLLKNNIWLVDRNYSVLYDDTTLKNIILNQWEKDYSGGDSQKRPDFLCMTSRDKPGIKIVLIEIKRPSITLTISMLEQVIDYKRALAKNSGTPIEDFQAYLVGKTINDKLTDYHVEGVKVKTYTDFIGEARRFYEEYMSIVEKEKYAF